MRTNKCAIFLLSVLLLLVAVNIFENALSLTLNFDRGGAITGGVSKTCCCENDVGDAACAAVDKKDAACAACAAACAAAGDVAGDAACAVVDKKR